jgi:hypothetical protein
MAEIGWATELKTVSDELIRQRIFRTGTINNKNLLNKKNLLNGEKMHQIWGWNDPQMQEEDKQLSLIIDKLKN